MHYAKVCDSRAEAQLTARRASSPRFAKSWEQQGVFEGQRGENEIHFVQADPLGGSLLACSNTVTQTNKQIPTTNEMLRSEGERGRRTNQQKGRLVSERVCLKMEAPSGGSSGIGSVF